MTPPSPILRVLRQSVEWSRDAFILAGLCMVCAYPFFHYQAHQLMPGIDPHLVNPHFAKSFMLFHMLMTFGAALICSMVGFFYSERLRLIGFGNIRDLKEKILSFLGLGILLIPFSYLLGDQPVLARFPEYYPGEFLTALGQPLIVLSQEVIARFGMVTILVYFWRLFGLSGHPWPAPIIIAAFTGFLAWLSLLNLGLVKGFDLFALRIVISAFIANLLFGEIYIRRGLLAAIVTHLGLEAKYLIYSFFI
jgi:hypothetical protein